MPSLIILKSPTGTEVGKVHPLDPSVSSFLLGRDAEECNIVIANSSVSRKHARILRSNSQYILEDLGSRNHTYLNGKQLLKNTALQSEDRIKICDYLFRFQDEVAPSIPKPFQPAHRDNSTVYATISSDSAKHFLEQQPSQRLLSLLEISRELAKAVEIDDLLQRLCDRLFKVFTKADRSLIILRNAQGHLIPKHVVTRRGNPGEASFSRTIIRRCLETKESFLSGDTSSEADLDGSASIAEFRIRSVMCVPLVDSNEEIAFGAIQLDAQDIQHKFSEADLQQLTIVGNLASIAIEKAQAIEGLLEREKDQRDIEIATQVQVGFLPKDFPDIPNYEFFAYYNPAQSVGGDYYDFIDLKDGRIAVILGDVAGKGVAAALLMAKLSAEVRYSLRTEPDLAKAIGTLNDEMIRGGIGDRFVTLAALVIDPASDQLTIVNAGHINPMCHRGDGELRELISDSESGIPLGLVTGIQYQSKTVPLHVGETVMVYTDGVTDAETPQGKRFMNQGIIDALDSDSAIGEDELRPQTVGDRLIQAVQKHANGQSQSDDIALVCFGKVEGRANTIVTKRVAQNTDTVPNPPKKPSPGE